MCHKMSYFVSPMEGSTSSDEDSREDDKTCRSRREEWEHDISKVMEDGNEVCWHSVKYLVTVTRY